MKMLYNTSREYKNIGYLKSCSLALIACLIFYGCSETETTHLDRIMKRGEIVVVTRNGPTSYYIEKSDQTGLEFELAKKFSEYLGVELKTIIAKNHADVIEILKTNRADFAAAALINTPDHDGELTFGPGYQWVTQQVVYRNGQRRPSSLKDMYPDKLDISIDTSVVLPLEKLKNSYSDLAWVEHENRDSHEMLELIENREILYTITDSNELSLARHYYPEIRGAFNVSPPQPVAWAFRKKDDLSLLKAVWRFHEKISGNGELAAMIQRFYGPVEKFDYVDSRKFVDRIEKRFPAYQPLFEDAADEQNIDWRLLAAVSYQESHWNEKAVSPTGVRGLMMLTQDTASTVGIKNRLDPEQSIRGGAIYLKKLMDKIPERIDEPDRTWMALAAYNVGFGHLEDARILTQRQGANPDSWKDVKERLPLLSRKKWYKQTRNGYARGVEPVLFVERIRKYFNTLVHLTQPEIQHFEHPSGQLVESVMIDSPVL